GIWAQTHRQRRRQAGAMFQSRDVTLSAAERDLILVRGLEDLGDHSVGLVRWDCGIEIDETAPDSDVLLMAQDAAESPHRRLNGRDAVLFTGGLRAASD